MTQSIQIFDCAELNSVDHVFVALDRIDARQIEWHRFSGLPKNTIERAIRRPRLSRYRAALGCAVQAAARGDILISHLPLMSGALEVSRLLGLRLPPHLAFAFNFTELPDGRRRRLLQRAFAGIDQFCVYSAYEIDLYSSFFDLPRPKFKTVLWTQRPPAVRPIAQTPRMRPFVAAIGYEGRDFACLVATARKLPNVDFFIFARPTGLLTAVPDNVAVQFNVPSDEVWGHALQSHAVLVPLLKETTCCGHITIVSAQQHGVPLITTRSHATREYVEGWQASCVVEPGDVEGMARSIDRVIDEHEKFVAAAARDKYHAILKYDRVLWDNYVADFIRSHL